MSGTVKVHLLRVEGGFGLEFIDSIIGSFPEGSVIALIDRDSIYDSRHLGSSFMHAARALTSGEGRARDQSLEVIRWLTGSRQVGKAIEMAGPRGDNVFIAAAAPEGWPEAGDADGIPDIELAEPGSVVFSSDWIIYVDPEIEGGLYGGNRALERLGIDVNDDVPHSGSMGVLELVACTNLR